VSRAGLIQLWVFIIGFLVDNLETRARDPIFRVLIALPIGWAVFGMSAVVVYGVSFSAASQSILLMVLAAITLALLIANGLQRRFSRTSLLIGTASLLVLAGWCVVVDALRIVTMTSDSAYIARFGQNIGIGDYEGSRIIFTKWGPLVPFIHSLTNVLGQKLYWQYQAVLGLNLIAVVSYTVYRLVRERTSRREALGAATVLTGLMVVSNIFVFHVFYIHVNVIAALYLYLLVFALMKMSQQAETSYGVLAECSLIGFSLVRIEAPLVAIVVLLISCFRQGWRAVDRVTLILPFIILLGAWYARVYFIVPDAADLLTRKVVVALGVVLMGFGVVTMASASNVLQAVVNYTPSLTLGALAATSVMFTLVKPAHMLTSLHSMLRNVLVDGNWGLTWYVVIFVATELFVVRRRGREAQSVWMVFVAYVLLVYNLGIFGEPYHTGEFDSANRLLLQGFPVLVLYLTTRYAAEGADEAFKKCA
jgi:hypothetical protein